MSKALKEYDFASGNASDKSSIATGSIGNVSSMLPTTPVPASPLSVPASPLSVPASPLSVPALPATTPMLTTAASTPSIPSPDSVPLSLSITEKKQDNKIQSLNNDKNNNNAASQFGDFDELLGIGGSFKPIQEFDNNKELKDFIKMFKKQNRKSYKSKNSSTRRNKKNNK
jgi:hypothetical protein